MRIILVRHGETEENTRHIMQGQTHGTLTEHGREQIRRTGERLSSERIDAAYASDLKRVTDTLDAIMAHHPGTPATHTPLLRERGMGHFEGKHRDLFFSAREKAGGTRVEWRPPGGENFHDVHARAEKFLSEILERHRGQNVLVVSHGAMLRMVLSVLLGLEKEEAFADEYGFGNTGIAIVTCTELGRGSAVCLNDTAHLGEKGD